MTVERSPLAPTPLIPESFAAKYREAGYWIDQTIPEFLLDACRAKPHFPALVAISHAQLDEDGKPQQIRLSYGELEAAGRAAAARLIQAGVQPGDRVLLQLGNCWVFSGRQLCRCSACRSTALPSSCTLRPALTRRRTCSLR